MYVCVSHIESQCMDASIETEKRGDDRMDALGRDGHGFSVILSLMACGRGSSETDGIACQFTRVAIHMVPCN